jgi:uncharacterized coiled-coil DUF342 family protein
MNAQAIARQAQEEHNRATLAETRREWEAVGREIDRKHREADELAGTIRELARYREELSRQGRELMHTLGDN